MDYNTFADFRRGLYACFHRAGDALMNANDALLTEVSAHSFIELSLSPCFVRRWPSLYEAMEDAVIDRMALQTLFAAQAPLPAAGQRLVLGVDASSILRPLSPTARDRSFVHAANLPEGSKPVAAGWQYSTLSVLPQASSSWTYVLDNQRIPSHKTQAQVATQQLESVLLLLSPESVLPLLLADGYYGSLTFLQQTKDLACDKLLRLAKNRVLYRAAPPRTGKRGAPKKDGARLSCNQPQTQGTPDQQWSGQEESGQLLEVACWQNLHFKEARDLSLSVIRVTRPQVTQSLRDPRVSWFVFVGQTLPPLSQVAALYARRYSLEHGYRVDKQDLLWATPRLRTPEAFDHWTDIVSSVRNQLFLVRPLVQAERRPWESRRRAATPQQVRRAAGRIIARLGTPAGVPQVRGKSPGRCQGAVIQKAPRYEVVYKAKIKATLAV